MLHKIIPNLWFDTKAEEAASSYISVFKSSRIVNVARLSEGGEEGPCGWLKDRYGLSWQVVPTGMEEVFADPDPERARRAMEAMLGMSKLDVAAPRAAADGVAASGPAGK